jgi:hypothetical protein
MAQLSVSTGDRLNIGSVLGRSFAILLGNLSSFLAISLATTFPLYALYFWLGYDFGIGPSGNASELFVSQVVAGILATFLSSTLAFVATGMIVYGTLRELQGRRAKFSDLVRRGIATVVPVLLVALVSSTLYIVGFALLVIPGLIVAVALWVAVPLAVVERRGLMASLRGSRELTWSYRGPIFGLLVLNLAVTSGFTYAYLAFLDYGSSHLRSVLIDWGTAGLFNAFWAVVTAVTYFDLKRIKEGAEVNEMAAVFD